MTSLYVGNFPYDVGEEDLKAMFTDAGFPPRSARIIIDRETGQPRGFGFVDVEDHMAQDAINLLSGQKVGGRPLRVALAAGRAPQAGRPSRGLRRDEGEGERPERNRRQDRR